MKKKPKTPLTDAMKKRRREQTRSQLVEGLFEGAVELGLMLVCFLVGAGIFALFGATLPADAELIALVGMLVLFALIALIGTGVACIHYLARGGKSQGRKTDAATETFKRRMAIINLQGLYDEVRTVVPTAVLDGFELRVEYRGQSLIFVQKSKGVFISRIGDEVIDTLDGVAACELAIRFAHDTGVGPIDIRDTWIDSASGGVIEYRDYFDRIHTLALIDLCPVEGCVGEADDKARRVTLYTRGAPLVIKFDARGARRGVLTGRRGQRYNKFKELISESGHRLCAAGDPKDQDTGK